MLSLVLLINKLSFTKFTNRMGKKKCMYTCLSGLIEIDNVLITSCSTYLTVASIILFGSLLIPSIVLSRSGAWAQTVIN